MSKNTKKRKRVIAFILLAFFIINIVAILIPVLTAKAESDSDDVFKTYVDIRLDGKMVSCDVLPFIRGQRTLVPVRFLMEALNATVDWDDSTKTVIIEGNNKSITLKAWDTKAYVNSQEVLLDVPADIIHSRVFVPLRFVSENMGLKVDWEDTTKTVVLTTINTSAPPEDNIGSNEGNNLNNGEKNEIGDGNENIIPDENGTDQEEIISNSLLDVSFSDYTITCNFETDKISYTKMILSSPTRLVIDFENCINRVPVFEMEENEYLNAFRYSQFTVNPDYVRLVLELKDNVEYEIHTARDEFFIILGRENFSSFVPPEEDTPVVVLPEFPDDPDKITIVIDPGHGGSDPGACGYDEEDNLILKEKDPNLEISLNLYELLVKKGYNVYMTRSTDTYVSLSQRADMANNLNADLFVSIHNNANDNLDASGTMVMYAYDEPKENMTLSGKQFAEVIQKHLVAALPGTNDYGAIKNSSLAVVKRTIMPAIIVEGLFVSNEADRALLMNPEVLSDIAYAVYEGLVEILE